ncbi:CBS domain-containing protein [Leptolyngbya sp. PCC 6406]|uniref:CBS domain-containing protein n=1 Tax=Leptolyngbya sp. PCC 6406 TaxID=1173264 RepID=UPI0002ABAD49|nr:CBS domain-containing protein [Leptolyngbya sp. PCC 6406]
MPRTVADVMTRDPITVGSNALLQEAIQIMADQRISGLPVISAEGSLVGILSETDLMWQATGAPLPAYVMLLDSVIYLKNPTRFNQELHKALGQTVAEVMSDHPVVTTQPEASLRAAAQLMHDKQVRRLPVLDDSGSLVGILTRGDIVREMARSYSDSVAETSP